MSFVLLLNTWEDCRQRIHLALEATISVIGTLILHGLGMTMSDVIQPM